MVQNPNDGYHTYNVTFAYKGTPNHCSFQSTAELTVNTDKLVAWDLADDAIKERMKTIPGREAGVYPHSIIIRGEFGELTVKD